ncbi:MULTISPECIES: SRPBCC family protein [Arthrobacter]|uniref:SRPBCC family protein n=2 Tax=Arthrobacter TaxID=1663 RepID=A0ABU9KHT6_9MICC|nr:SRPBCC family protein [Arthrobacter sp. YJM1]MDP5225934.1 SRPBCC family protein [Arthrobacter sp. YJM1]
MASQPTRSDTARSPHLYDLRSEWHLPAPVEDVWAVITDLSLPVGPLPWWPGCRLTAPLASGSPPSLRTTTARLEFRSGLGYRLRVDIQPRHLLAPHLLDADAGGDLLGTGRLRLSPADGGRATVLRIEWRVRPVLPWMIRLSPVLAPLFAAAHGRVMKRGELGLAARLLDGK